MRLPRLPDLLTTANLACGVASILLASQGQLTWACGLVFIAAVFDVFDGLAARAMGGGTPLGAQLDSLADMVSFGVAPAMLVYCTPVLLQDPVGALLTPYATTPHPFGLVGIIAPLVLAMCSMWRLAKFNLDTRQSTGFLGLPTPSNGLFWVSMVLVSLNVAVHPGPGHDMLADLVVNLMESSTALMIACVGMAILMLSELPLPGLKFKHFRWQGNQVIFVIAGLGAMLVVLYGILAVPLILVVYVLSPLWGRVFPAAGR